MTIDLQKKRARERLRRQLQKMLTKQKKPLPFESGPNVLPGSEAFFRANRKYLYNGG